MICLLKLGHRIHRDFRLDTHLALTARAFLVDKIVYSGQKDSEFENCLKEVNEKFGTKILIEHVKDYKKFIKNFDGKKVHLTMYGINYADCLNDLKDSDVLIVVGGEKVESEIYNLVDYNLSVTNQPISEVSALGIFLHDFNQGKELSNDFDGKLKIVPQIKGKKVVKLKGRK